MSDESDSTGRRIVVGVDGSESSKDALRWAAHQARLEGASVQAVMTWRLPMAAYGGVPFPTGIDFGADAATALAATIAEVLGDEPDVTVTPVVTEGIPALELLSAAAGADLLVVGSRGHGAFTGMLVGSVSEHCVAHSPCPVVVVRHTSDPA